MPLPVNNTSLVNEMRKALFELEEQIKHIKNDLKNEYPDDLREKINVWYWTRKANGDYVLADLLVARANLLAAIANLQAKR